MRTNDVRGGPAVAMRPGPWPGTPIALISVLLLSYLWLWHGTIRGHFFVCVGLYFAIGAWSHRRRGESASAIGLRLDNIGPALWWTVKLAGPLFVLPVAIGAWLGTLQPFAISAVPGALAWGWLWGTMQQYGLVCVFYRRFREQLGDGWGAALAAAGLFALFHLPNPFLTPVTFVSGIVACRIYRREPNLLVLGLMHALLSGVLRQSLGPDITHHMRVGPGYWEP